MYLACAVRNNRRNSAENNVIHLYDASLEEEGQDYFALICRLEGHGDYVGCLAFSSEAAPRLATGSADRTIRIWQLDQVSTAPGPRPLENAGDVVKCTVLRSVWEINAICFNHSDSSKLTSRDFRSIRVWDLSTPAPTIAWEVEVFRAYAKSTVCFSVDDRLVISSTRQEETEAETMISMWDAETGQCVQTFRGAYDNIACVAISPSGQTFAVSCYTKNIHIWQYDRFDSTVVLKGHEQTVYTVAFTNDGARLLSGSADETIRMWDVRMGTLMRTVRCDDTVWSLSTSIDGTKVACGFVSNGFAVFDIETGDKVAQAFNNGNRQEKKGLVCYSRPAIILL
jgi:WD40 repeat protein